MPDTLLNLDVALGVTIPARNARGRLARHGPVLDSILANHGYPQAIERLLSEALVLTALLGTMLKEPEGQVTVQAQTQDGIVDLLVCDYLGGQLRGYVKHDPERLADAGPNPSLQSLFGKGYLAVTFDHPNVDERYQGIVPLEAESLARAAESFFAQSEQIPSIVRLAAEKRAGGWVGGGLLFQHLPEGEEGRDRLHTRLDHPDWPHVAILAGSVKPEELTDPAIALDDLTWRLFHEEAEVRTLDPLPLSKGCRCDPDYVRSVIARFPAEERAAMVGEDGMIRVDCAFCSTSFPIALEDVSETKR
jgi:molecular chaperone Hsp33